MCAIESYQIFLRLDLHTKLLVCWIRCKPPSSPTCGVVLYCFTTYIVLFTKLAAFSDLVCSQNECTSHVFNPSNSYIEGDNALNSFPFECSIFDDYSDQWSDWLIKYFNFTRLSIIISLKNNSSKRFCVKIVQSGLSKVRNLDFTAFWEANSSFQNELDSFLLQYNNHIYRIYFLFLHYMLRENSVIIFLFTSFLVNHESLPA